MNQQTKAKLKGWLNPLLPDGIRERLLLLIALALIPLLLLIGWTSYQSYETRRDQALQTEVEVARGISTTFAAYVEGVQQQNYAVGQAIVTDTTHNQANTKRLLTVAAAHYPAVRNLSWASPEGRVLVSSQANLEGRDLSIRPYFQEILAGHPWAIGDLSPSGISTNAPTFAIATAIRDPGGKLTGVMAAGIEPTRLGELIFTQQRPADGAYTIFDSQGVWCTQVGVSLFPGKIAPAG
jgi:C4-dicarboxylate-specific signal transduction histidine kinase